MFFRSVENTAHNVGNTAQNADTNLTHGARGPVGPPRFPPLFESMEIIGKDVTLARLKGLAEHL